MEDITIKEDKSFDEVAEKNEATEKPEEKPNKSNNPEKPKKESKGKNVAITILSIAVLALSATLAFLLINSKKDNQGNKQNETSKTEEKKEEKANEESSEPVTTQEEVELNDKAIKDDISKKIATLHFSIIEKDGIITIDSFRVSRTAHVYDGNLTDMDKLQMTWLSMEKYLAECTEKELNSNVLKEMKVGGCHSAKIQDVSKWSNKLFGEETKMDIKDDTQGGVNPFDTGFAYDPEEEKYYGFAYGVGGIPGVGYTLLEDGYYTKGDYVNAYYRASTIALDRYEDNKQTLYNGLGFLEEGGDRGYMGNLSVVKETSDELKGIDVQSSMEENRSAFARYRFVFKLDNSGTNYIFDHVEKV